MDKKLTALTLVTKLTNEDLVYVVQGGESVAIKVKDFLQLHPISILRKEGDYFTSIPLSYLTEIYDNAQAGDVVYVRNGTYNLGTGQIILTDGVNWRFDFGVIINSDNVTATIWDNNVAVTVYFDGAPTITNSNGSDYEIVLDNASSQIIYSSGIQDYFRLCDTSGGDVTVNLPAAIGWKDRKYIVKADALTGGVVYIQTNGSETIDGAPALVINNPYGKITLISDGSNWYII